MTFETLLTGRSYTELEQMYCVKNQFFNYADTPFGYHFGVGFISSRKKCEFSKQKSIK